MRSDELTRLLSERKEGKAICSSRMPTLNMSNLRQCHSVLVLHEG